MNEQDTIVFGIDLGTTYSCIAYINEYGVPEIVTNFEGQRTTPSVVHFDNEYRVVGKEAKNYAQMCPGEVVELVQRHMGEEGWRFYYGGVDYTPEEISSYILRKLAADTEERLGVKVTNVVITCPAYFGVNQCEGIVKAGEIAGLKVWEVLNEPTAAAIMYGMQQARDQMVLVYDLGGGSFNTAALEIKDNAIRVIAIGGDHYLGGRNWDESIVKYLAETWMEVTGAWENPIDTRETLQDLLMKVEAAKWTLSARQEASIMVDHEGQHVRVKLTREKFDELTALWLERTVMITKSMMDEVKKRGYTNFDQILLVGGSTRMPQVKARLEQEFGLPIQKLDPDEAGAKGAAIYAQKLLISDKINYDLTQVLKTSAEEIDMIKASSEPMRQVLTQVAQEIGLKPFGLNTRPNFFLLLGMNPDEHWDQVRFETVLKQKQRQWGKESTGIGPRAMAAKQFIKLLPKIQHVMNDPTTRENEIIEARKELAYWKKGRIEKFEHQLQRAQSKGYLEETEFKNFVKDFTALLSELEIRGRVTVPIQAVAAGPRKLDQLDTSVAKEIAQKLSAIHAKTLYELLGKPPTHSYADLYTLANQLYLDMIKRPPSPETTLKMELAGFAMKIFETDSMRTKYDAMLRKAEIDALLKDLEEIVNRTTSKEVHLQQSEDFLDLAGKVGWGRVEALVELKIYARTHKWILIAPDPTTTQQQRCGFCSQINDMPRKFCQRCNRELNLNCPNCGQPVEADAVDCGNCGFRVGDRFWVDDSVTHCRQLIAKKNVSEAQQLLTELEATWKPLKTDPRLESIKDCRARFDVLIEDQRQSAKAQRKNQQQIKVTLERLIRERKFCEARQVLSTQSSTISDRDSYQRRIDSALAEAQKLLAPAYSASLSYDDRVASCEQALVLCVDYQEARDLLKTISPPQQGLQTNVKDILTKTYKAENYGHIQTLFQTENSTITVVYQESKERTIPFLAPPSPPYELIGRNDLLVALKQRLLVGENLALSALNGLPGVGKTALAIALTHDREVIRHFSDGILWAGLGREADKLSLLDIWGMAVGIPKLEMERLASFNARKIAIHNAIGLRRMLLVIDDAWSVEDAEAFKLGGPLCAHVVTTRFPQISEVFAGEGATVVKELDEDDGLVLLKRLVPNLMETVPGEALDLVHLVGGLPLPLILMGNYLRIQMNTGQTRRLRSALNQLRQMEERLKLKQYQGGLERHTSLPEGVPLSQLAVIKISDEALDKDTRYTLRALSVFPSKPNSFSEEAALFVAGTSTTAIDTLADFGLLENSGSGRYTLHQTISDYAQYELSDIAVYKRMVEYFIEYVETHKIDYNLLEQETSNILAAVEIYFERELEIGRGAKALSHFIHMLRRTRKS